MAETAIRVRELGKRYRIGAAPERYRTLRDAVSRGATMPFRRLRGVLRGESTILAASSFWAVDDVSFDVERGEVLGLVGRNGAGKTTLLKLLSRITEPTRGRAELHGRVGSLLEVGTGFHPELTGRENIFLNGAILGMRQREIEARFDEIVAFAEVERFIHTQVKHYSSGMYLRLAFAVAAHLDTEILLVDEVLAVGDQQFQRRCIGKMGDVARSGRTVLFVSHNLEAVQRLCSRCLWLDEGRIAADGEPAEVIHRYLQRWRQAVSFRYRADALPAEESAAAGPAPGDAVLVEAEVLDATGRAAGHLRYGEPFALRMRWRNRRALPGAYYFVSAQDEQGRELFGVNPGGLLPLEAGEQEVLCRFENNVLVPGDYRFTVGCFLPPKTFLHRVEDALGLAVLEVPFATGPVSIAQRSIFDPRPSWQVAPAAQSPGEPRAALSEEGR
ncbi:MAG TPA: ABC transporter ATP-binding protein [Thermoanaerobaculia bacterium]|nr:ABC transporter ATP-binding protein [Thermoanaerobaculia bacterium]